MIKLTKEQHSELRRITKDLGFQSVDALVHYLVDDMIQRNPPIQQQRIVAAHRTHEPDSLRSRILDLPPGTRFTVDSILVKGDSRRSVGVMLHQFHGKGLIALLQSSRRTKSGWEPAIFVRK